MRLKNKNNFAYFFFLLLGERPSANDIRNALLSVDLLCLKREAAICKEQSVECMAVRKYIEDGKEKQEVWVASGQCNSGGNQLSWFSINPDKKQVKH